MGKQRDSEGTKGRVFKAIAEILRDQGFAGLDISSIAKKAGMHRKVIYYHFDNLHNCLRQFIQREDYWTLFFEKYQLTELPAEQAIQDMFIEMMQGNLKFFTDHEEMQEIILWQISHLDPLTRRISEKREEEGAALLNLTDPFFINSQYDFRMIISLLLGGTYYLVLHSKNNKSKVAGRDLNLPDDWWRAHTSIAQVIKLVWAAAAEERNQTEEPNMNYAFEKLRNLAAELVLKRPVDDNSTEPASALTTECYNLQMVMMRHLLKLKSKTRIKTYLYINLHTLVSVCDSLYCPARKYNADAQVVLDLLDSVRQQLGGYIPGNLIIPRMLRDRENRNFQEQWLLMKNRMQELKIDIGLQHLMHTAFLRFGDPKLRMEWGDFKYLRKFSKRLQTCLADGLANEEMILHTLVGLGYNDTLFIHYCFERMRDKVANEEGVADREELLVKYRSAIKQVVQLTKMRFDNYKRPVVEELTKWIDAELEVLGRKKTSGRAVYLKK